MAFSSAVKLNDCLFYSYLMTHEMLAFMFDKNRRASLPRASHTASRTHVRGFNFIIMAMFRNILSDGRKGTCKLNNNGRPSLLENNFSIESVHGLPLVLFVYS